MIVVSQSATSIVDPTQRGRLGMSLFLASEAMFFVGLLGSFLVLQSGQRELFHHMASMLSTRETSVLVLLLLAASAVMLQFPRPLRDTGLWPVREGTEFQESQLPFSGLNPQGPEARVTTAKSSRLWIAIGFAAAFAVVQLLILQHLLSIHTIVARIDGKASVFNGQMDGSLLGTRGDLPPNFDATRMTNSDFVCTACVPGIYNIPAASVLQDVTYGPSRNNYLGCYFLITATHLVHLVAGILAMIWLASRNVLGTAKAVDVSCVSSYWHFVNVVGVLGLLLLYFA